MLLLCLRRWAGGDNAFPFHGRGAITHKRSLFDTHRYCLLRQRCCDDARRERLSHCCLDCELLSLAAVSRHHPKHVSPLIIRHLSHQHYHKHTSSSRSAAPIVLPFQPSSPYIITAIALGLYLEHMAALVPVRGPPCGKIAGPVSASTSCALLPSAMTLLEGL